MVRVAVIGEPVRIHGYDLPGAILYPATDQAEAVLAWRDLPDEIDVAVLTPSAARWLATEIARRPWVLPVLLAETPSVPTLAELDALAGPRAVAGPGALAGVMPEGGPLPEPGGLEEPGAPTGPAPSPEPGAGAEPRVPPLPPLPPRPPVPPGHGCEPQA